MRLRSKLGMSLIVLALLFSSACSNSDSNDDGDSKSDGQTTGQDAGKDSGQDDGSDDTGSGDTSTTEGIEVVTSGFAIVPADDDNDEFMSVAVEFRNTTDKIAYDIDATIITLDADGNEIESNSSPINVMLPGTTTTVAYVSDDIDTNVASVTGTADVDEWVDPAAGLGEFTIGDITISAVSAHEMQFAGDLTSTIDVEFEDLDIQVVLYDTDGNPVAETSGYLDESPLAANGTTQFTLPMYRAIPSGWTAKGFAQPQSLDGIS